MFSIKGQPTFLKEHENIQTFNAIKIPTLETIYFKNWESDGHQRAIIITKELDGYLPLSCNEYQFGSIFVSTKQKKLALFERLAKLMRMMHTNDFQHDCFYLKHVFAKTIGDDFDLRVIDLEKARKRWSKKSIVFRDLYTLSRHAPQWGVRDQLRFYRIYMNEVKLTPKSKRLWRELSKKNKKKSKPIL